MSLRVFLPLYRALWGIGLPLVLVYLWWRGRRDPDYRRHIGERFGRYRRAMPGTVWVHAVSLGEVRSAIPIVRALLDRGERVVITHFTPAGRRETQRVLADDIAEGRLAAIWVPFDTSRAYKAFFAIFRPRLGLVMEVEHWPGMILAAERAGVPLFPCNAQYPARSFDADRTRRRWRMQVIGRYAGALVKSDLQATRFRAAGLSHVEVTGETRFDQPVPAEQVAAGLAARRALAPNRRVIAIASAVEGEDETYLQFIALLRDDLRQRGEAPPLVVYVPRRPERFELVHAALAGTGLRLARRGAVFGPDLNLSGQVADLDILLGDSLGEMYFYLAMADRVIVGAGFSPKGAHNIIEPLALGKPVVTGPVTWTIEYPFEEARAAGLAQAVEDAAGLVRAVLAPAPPPEAIAAFFAAHSGAAGRTLAAIDRLVPPLRPS